MEIPLAGHIDREQNRQIGEVFERDRQRLRQFIRRHVADWNDAEDILQDVFYEFVVAQRLMKPVEHAGAWLFRVARNRITDLFRKKKAIALEDAFPMPGGEEGLLLDELLPSGAVGPEAAYARAVMIADLEDALDELPRDQRAVFLAHEVEGRSFKEIAAETGVSVNTLISRKRYAVVHLRARLRQIYDDFKEEWG